MVKAIVCMILLLLGNARLADAHTESTSSLSLGAQPVDTSRSDPPSYAYQHWTVEEGLPVNTVRDLAQGPRGYLWMITYDGLVRFDGVQFHVMRTANSALPTNRLYRFWLGPENDLWVKTSDDRIVRVDPRRQEVIRIYGKGRNGVEGGVNRMRMTEDGTRWLATTKMLYRRPSGETAWRPVLPDTMDVGAVAVGPDGDVWAGTAQRGVWRVQAGTAEQIAVSTADGRRPRDIRALSFGSLGTGADASSTVWIGGSNGVFRLTDGRLHSLRSGDGPWTERVPALSVAPDGRLWICTWVGGLYTTRGSGVDRRGDCSTIATNQLVYADRRGEQWVMRESRVTHNGRTIFRAGGEVRDLLVDREGNRWIATTRDGLYRLRRTPVTMVDTANGLQSMNVYGIVPVRSARGALWVTSIHGGLAHLETGTGGAVEIENVTDRWNLPGIVWTIATAPDGTRWIGGPQGLFRRRDGRTTQDGLPSRLQQRAVRAVYRDRNGRLWTLVDGVLYVCDEGTWRTHARDVAGGALGRVATQTRNGSVWIGTDTGGLLRVRDDTVEAVTTEDGLSSNRIRSIYEDSTGVLWIGTEDRGLTRIDRRGTLSMQDDHFTTITRQDGLPDNVIHQILPDDHGRLWMSTNRGIFSIERSRLDAYARGETDRLRPVLYTEADGLSSREANGGVHSAGTRTADGRLWFPTQEGVAVIDPDAVQTAPPPPSVIEAVAARDTTYAVQADTSLRLQVRDRTFTVRYAGLHFANPAATRFRVMLEGLDPAPTQTGQRTVRYTNVGPGTYTLRVQAAGERGAWGEATTLTMTVPPYWWETTWFYVLCGLGLLGLGIAGYRWRVRHLRRRQEDLERTVEAQTEEVRRQRDRLEQQAERLQELDDAKSRFFANVSHEFRTPLTLILGPVRDLRERVRKHLSREDAERLTVVDRNARRLLRLVNQILGLARLDADTYQIDARPTTLDREVGRIARSFEPHAERKHLTLAVETHPAPDEPAPVYVDREALEHILSNLLSNAIKFTPSGGRVEVAVRETEEAAEVVVRDTGVGIPKSEQDGIFDRFAQVDDTSTRPQEGAGIGLAFAQDLVDLHGGSIHLDSTEGEGTTVAVRFLRGCDHLHSDQIADEAPSDELSSSAPVSGSEAFESLATTESLASRTSALAPSSTPEDISPPPSSPASGDQSQIDTRQSTRASATDEAKQSKIVLIVDDNPDVRQYVRSILDPDWAVIEAANGEEGLRAAGEQLPDVILADVMMPGMDGVEMTRRMKNDPETEAIPVIMVTARAGTTDELEGLEAGADDYVTKPFDADVLRQRVEGVIALQERLRRRLREQIRAETAEEAVPDDGSAERPEVEQEARRMIREHLTEAEFDVDALARAMGISRATLYRRFDAATDVTPAALITQVRIEEAKVLLRDGEGSVTQVAYAVGFEQLSSFSRAFREQVGQPPSALASNEA